jgi:hypothetical protein
LEDSSFIPEIGLDSTSGITMNFDSDIVETLSFDFGIVGILDFKEPRIGGDVFNFISDADFESPSISSVRSGREPKLEVSSSSSSSLLMRSTISQVEELV